MGPLAGPVEDELEAVPGVVEEDVEGRAEHREAGGVAGQGEVGGVGGVLLAEELGAFAPPNHSTQRARSMASTHSTSARGYGAACSSSVREALAAMSATRAIQT